jgi:hypothetical protein
MKAKNAFKAEHLAAFSPSSQVDSTFSSLDKFTDSHSDFGI